MRAILFRGKDLDDDWVYGDLIHFNRCVGKVGICVYAEKFTTNAPWIVHVKADSIGQYTGFKDKNGKKIFEGDILKNGDGVKAEISYSRGSFCITIYDLLKNKVLIPFKGLLHIHDYEVIGNIYDNPKLLQEIRGNEK